MSMCINVMAAMFVLSSLLWLGSCMSNRSDIQGKQERRGQKRFWEPGKKSFGAKRSKEGLRQAHIRLNDFMLGRPKSCRYQGVVVLMMLMSDFLDKLHYPKER